MSGPLAGHGRYEYRNSNVQRLINRLQEDRLDLGDHGLATQDADMSFVIATDVMLQSAAFCETPLPSNDFRKNIAD